MRLWWRGCFLVLCVYLELGRCISGCDEGWNIRDNVDACRDLVTISRLSRVLLQDIVEGSAAEEVTAPERAADDAPALIQAVRAGDITRLRMLIRASADVDVVDDQNRTALWFGAIGGNLEVVKTLLDAGADPNIKSADGTTPLYIVSALGDVALAETLVRHGADIEATTEKGATPLLMASQAGRLNVVTYLIGAGADVSVVKKASGQSSLWSAAFFGHDQIVKTLLSAGAKPDMPEVSGATPLYAASQEGHLEPVLLLYEAGAEVNSITSGKKATPLHVAAAACHADVVATLLLFGGNPRSPDSSGALPDDVICIEETEDEELIETLLSYSASLDKVIELQEVLDRGVTFKPPILEWIKRLLNPPPLEIGEVRIVTGYSGLNSSDTGVSESGLLPKTARRTDSELLALILIASVVGFILATIMFCTLLSWTRKQKIKPEKIAVRSIPGVPEGVSGRSAQRTIRHAPVWKEPQMPRPTMPRRGSLDSNPATLPNQTNDIFSRDTLLEWLREPQYFTPSNRWDLEPQIPGVAASEGSKSSAQGMTVVNWNHERSRSFSSGGHSSRGKKISDREPEASSSLPQGQMRPLTLWHIDPATRSSATSQHVRSENIQSSVASVQHQRYESVADEPGPSTSTGMR